MNWNARDDDGEMKLELVQVLFRHGARTPIVEELNVYNQIADPSLYQPLGLGALNAEGKKQEYEFGSFLRKRYDGFLNSDYKSEEIYACSTNTHRTKMSLQLVLAGLYPPTESTVWHPDLNWSPVPYSYLPEKLDVLLKYYEHPEFRKLVKQAYDSDEFKRTKIMKYREFLDYLESMTGVNFDDKFFYLAFVYGMLASHESMNLPLPDWYTQEVKHTFIEAMGTVYDGFAFTSELKKLGAGPIIKTFVDNMNLDRKMINPRKIYLYSAHDGNLAIFTRAHGIQEFRYPPFGSALILEKLRNSNNEIFIRLLVWSGNGELSCLKVGNHKKFCPIDDYLEIIQTVIPEDWELDEMLGKINIVKLKQLFFNDSVVKNLKQ